MLLKREGWEINAKRVYRLYKLEGLSLRLKRTKKQVSRLRVAQPAAIQPHERWSLDFMSDQLGCGRRIRVLTGVDHFSRVSPVVEVDVSLSGSRVVEVFEAGHCGLRLAQNFVRRQWPGVQRTCIRPGALWAEAHKNKVKLHFSRPGKPGALWAVTMP